MSGRIKSKTRVIQGIVTILIVVIGFSAYYSYQSTTSIQHKNDQRYSFEKPGQLLPSDSSQPPKSSKFTGLSAEQLNQAASDLIKQADAIVLANPVQAESITKEQQAVIDKKTRELEDKIKALEKNLAN